MYTRIINRKRISLGLALHGMPALTTTEDILPGLKKEENEIAFMKIRVKTSAGSIDAIAAMKSSYSSLLVSEMSKHVIRMLDSSTIHSSKRMCLPKSTRCYAGMPENGEVYVVERNGYAVISPNEAIGEIEPLPFDARATTIDVLVAGIVRREQLKREAAAIYQ